MALDHRPRRVADLHALRGYIADRYDVEDEGALRAADLLRRAPGRPAWGADWSAFLDAEDADALILSEVVG